MYLVKLTEQASIDLRDTLQYISFNLGNEIAAQKFNSEVRKQFALVAEFPEMYRLNEDELLAKKGVRKMIIKKYLAFYVIYEEIKTVYVLRVLHASCNWLSIMRNEAVKL